MAKKDYSNVTHVTEKDCLIAPITLTTRFVRIDPIVNGKKVFIDVIRWDGNISGVMNEIYKQCGFMENHLYHNVRQELVHLRHKYHYEPRKNENIIIQYTGNLPTIKKVKFNDPATIVFWADNTKTVVKCQDGDVFDPEKGLAMAISKKALGNKGNYCNELRKWLPKDKEATLEYVLNMSPQSIDDIGKKIVDAVNKKLNGI